ncbi:MAG: metal-binding protein [Ruminococcus sp.]|nr:metal-binding protein [Ruminococcus sp.]
MKQYRLIGKDGKEYLSDLPGTLGGHRKLKIYGRLDCPSSLRHIAKGNYVRYRVFFADEETAVAAGFRPCGICMKEEYLLWKKIDTAEKKK